MYVCVRAYVHCEWVRVRAWIVCVPAFSRACVRVSMDGWIYACGFIWVLRHKNTVYVIYHRRYIRKKMKISAIWKHTGINLNPFKWPSDMQFECRSCASHYWGDSGGTTNRDWNGPVLTPGITLGRGGKKKKHLRTLVEWVCFNITDFTRVSTLLTRKTHEQTPLLISHWLIGSICVFVSFIV